MSEENKPKVAPLKPPPRVLKAAAGGVENKIAVGAGNGVESNGMKFRPVSESFAKHDVEKGQFMFKLAPRQKDGADTTKTLSSAASAPNLLNDNDGNGDGDSKPAPPRRNPVSPPIEGELRPKGLKSAAGPSPSPTSAVSPPQLKQATFKAKPSPSPSSSTNNSPTSPHPGPANNESPAPAGGAIGGVVLKKAAPRPAPRPSTDESPSPSPAQSPPPPVALPPTTPPPPDVVEESEGSSQFAKARAALAADLTAEKSVSPPVPAAATRVKPAPPKAPDTKEESSENAGNKFSPSIEGAAPAPLKPRALKPAPSPSQDKPGDTPPPQPKPMAKKVVIQAEPNGEEATAKVNFRKSVAPQEGSVAAKAYRMSLPPSELNRIANDPPIPQLKPVAPRVIAPAPASAPAPTSSPAPAPVSAAQEPGDSTSQAPKPVIRKIAIPPGIQDGEPTDTSQKAGFRKSSFPPVQKEEEGGPEHSPPATKAQKAAFRVSSFHPPTNDTDKISPFGHPFKPKPMARKVAPSPPTEQSNTPPPVLDQSNTPAESTSAPVAPVPARPKPFAPKPQPQKTEDASSEAESTQPVQPAAQLRPKFAPRPQQSKPSASPSDSNQPISPPPRAKLPASKPPAGFANLKKVEPSEQADSIQTQEENQIVSQAPDHATSDPIPYTTDSSSTPVSQDVASPTLVSEPPTSYQNVPSPTPAPVVVPRILRPVSVQIASSPEPPRAKQSPKPKPVASPPQSDPTAEPAAPPRPPKPIALSTEQAAVSPPPVSPPPSAETPKSTAPPRPPKHFKKPSDGNLDIEGVATPASVNSAPEPSQDSPPQVTPDRPRKILGSGLVSSGGIKKAPIRPPPPEQPPADLPPPDLPPPDLPPPPDNIPTEIPPESAAMPIYASSELPVAAEQPPTDIPPPFPARPKRSAPKAPSSRSIVEAPTDLPPPPPPLDVEEPEIVPVADPDPPKAVWVASGHHAADSRPRVRAVTDYEAQAEGQLTFPQGAIMYVVERTNEGYMGCEYNGAIGWVINSFIEEIGVEAMPVHRPSQRATTQLQLGVHHQQPVSPRQTASPPVPAQESPRQAAPKPITKQVSVQRLGSAQPKPAAQPPPPPPAAEDDEDVGSKLDLIAPTGPRLANPKRAGPRKGARPPTRGVQPKIKTKMTTEDAATGPRADLSAVASSGAPSSVGEDGMIAPRRIIAPGNPSMNIAALAVDQKGKLKNTRESVAITPTTQQERAQFKAQFATTAGSYTPPKPVEEEVKEVKEVSKEKDKKSKGLFGILGGGKKKKDKS